MEQGLSLSQIITQLQLVLAQLLRYISELGLYDLPMVSLIAKFQESLALMTRIFLSRIFKLSERIQVFK
jgi:hypothetical protein